MIYNIRRIIEYIYIDLPAPVPSSRKKDKEKIRKIEEMLAHINSKLGSVKSPSLAKKIEGMIDEIKGAMAQGNVSEAESAAEELEKFTSSAAEVTERLFYNIQKAKTLFWALPPQARRSLEAVIKAAEKQLAGGTDLADMASMNKTLERALYLAGRIADAGPGALHEVGAELRELAHIAVDTTVMGTDHLSLSDSALKKGADMVKGAEMDKLPFDDEKLADKLKQGQPGPDGPHGPRGPKGPKGPRGTHPMPPRPADGRSTERLEKKAPPPPPPPTVEAGARQQVVVPRQ